MAPKSTAARARGHCDLSGSVHTQTEGERDESKVCSVLANTKADCVGLDRETRGGRCRQQLKDLSHGGDRRLYIAWKRSAEMGGHSRYWPGMVIFIESPFEHGLDGNAIVSF